MAIVTPVAFLKEVRVELKKVVWPTRQQVIQFTILVIFISVLVGLLIGALDYIFVLIMEVLL